MMNPVADIVGIVRRVIEDGSHALARPTILREDVRNVTMCAEIEPGGEKFVRQFEAELMAITKSKHVIAVSSGTAALHLALMAGGVRPGDEVLVPALTFVATANAVCHAGATPHFVDVRASDLGILPFKLRQYLAPPTSAFIVGDGENRRINIRTGKRIAALVPVHLLGIPGASLQTIGTLFDIPIIEDAAQALGSVTEDGRHCGTAGRLGILSFNANKIVTTGGGGAVLTDDDDLAGRVRHLATNAKVPHPSHWYHDEIGWNYRMPNLCAALGLHQLTRLARILKAKRELAFRYIEAFRDCESATMIGNGAGNNWVNAILLDPRCADDRDAVLRALLAGGFQARAMFMPLQHLPMFRNCPRQESLLGAEDIFRRAICLPSTVEVQ
jgi:perosamine synthetase